MPRRPRPAATSWGSQVRGAQERPLPQDPQAVEQVLKDIGTRKEDIDDVLVSGCTRTRKI